MASVTVEHFSLGHHDSYIKASYGSAFEYQSWASGPNSSGGWSIYLELCVNAVKKVNCVIIDITTRNKEGDDVYCQIGKVAKHRLEATGPFTVGERKKMYWEDFCYYPGDLYIMFGYATLMYNDGTSEEIDIKLLNKTNSVNYFLKHEIGGKENQKSITRGKASFTASEKSIIAGILIAFFGLLPIISGLASSGGYAEHSAIVLFGVSFSGIGLLIVAYNIISYRIKRKRANREKQEKEKTKLLQVQNAWDIRAKEIRFDPSGKMIVNKKFKNSESSYKMYAWKENENLYFFFVKPETYKEVIQFQEDISVPNSIPFGCVSLSYISSLEVKDNTYLYLKNGSNMVFEYSDYHKLKPLIDKSTTATTPSASAKQSYDKKNVVSSSYQSNLRVKKVEVTQSNIIARLKIANMMFDEQKYLSAKKEYSTLLKYYSNCFDQNTIKEINHKISICSQH